MDNSSPDNSLLTALRQFGIADANLLKLERLWKEIEALMPNGIAFGENAAYEEKCYSFGLILSYLPRISGWKPVEEPW